MEFACTQYGLDLCLRPEGSWDPPAPLDAFIAGGSESRSDGPPPAAAAPKAGAQAMPAPLECERGAAL